MSGLSKKANHTHIQTVNLSETQVKTLAKDPKARKLLKISKEHSRRLKFHADIVLQRIDASRYYAMYMQWIGKLLPADKQTRFEDLLTFPMATNELMKDVFTALGRVWYAKNYFEKYTFSAEEFEKDFELYRETIKEDHLWKVEAWSAMKTAIDSVIIVDLPAIQAGERPCPYFYILEPDDIIDIEVNCKNEIEYIIFESEDDDTNEKDCIAVYDDFSLRKYEKDDKGIGKLIVEIPHTLGYTPARMLWSDKLADENMFNKRSPITDVLSDLDWYLFYKTAEKYLNLYAPFPIYVSYEFQNDSKDDDPVKGTETEQAKEDKHEGSPLMGPGSYITVPAPETNGDTNLMANPVQVVGAAVDACKWVQDKVQLLRTSIFRSIVGYDGEINKAAINEKQVESGFKSREEVLMYIARNLGQAKLWTNETIARLRYSVYFVKGDIDFGSDFYLQDESEFVTLYADAKVKGASSLVLDTIEEQLLDVVYRNDPQGRMKARLIKDLDPLPGMTNVEALAAQQAGVISTATYLTKINFQKYARMFELEFAGIPNDNYNSVLSQMNAKFEEYASEQTAGA